MKKSFVIAFALTTGLLSASAAQANDAVLGAVIGGGLGAVVGNHVSGRDGAIIGAVRTARANIFGCLCSIMLPIAPPIEWA